MKDIGLKLYQAIFDLINGIADTHNVIPANKSFPYIYLGEIIAEEPDSAKDRFFTFGTVDVSIYTATLTAQGSKSELLTLTNSVKLALKATKTSVLTLADFNMTIWKLSNQSQRHESTRDKNIFINTLQYYFEIEQL